MLRKKLCCTAAGLLSLFLLSCADEEQEQLLAQFQADLNRANATIDSLTYSLDDSHLMLDAMRAQVDSTQRVNEQLVVSAQKLSKELRQWTQLANQYKQNNERLTAEIERLKVEKQADRQIIARLRSQADSLNGVLLEAHTSIRRQSDHIRKLERDLAQAQDQVESLQAAQVSVRLYMAAEKFLEENGYLDSSRPFGRGFRKQYKLMKKLNPEDPGVRLAPIGQAIAVEGKLNVLVDRYGKLKEGDDYQEKKQDGQTAITFVNQLMGGADVLVVLQD
jgi:chromosome segregation ATPase